MTMSPCLECGEPAHGTRCDEHTIDPKPTAQARGYDAAWNRLSRRARRLQPWCSSCGSVDDLQADHSPEAWARRESGLPVRLQDVTVKCGPCNRAAGAARGPSATRGDAPADRPCDPVSSPSLRLTPPGAA